MFSLFTVLFCIIVICANTLILLFWFHNLSTSGNRTIHNSQDRLHYEDEEILWATTVEVARVVASPALRECTRDKDLHSLSPPSLSSPFSSLHPPPVVSHPSSLSPLPFQPSHKPISEYHPPGTNQLFYLFKSHKTQSISHHLSPACHIQQERKLRNHLPNDIFHFVRVVRGGKPSEIIQGSMQEIVRVNLQYEQSDVIA